MTQNIRILGFSVLAGLVTLTEVNAQTSEWVHQGQSGRLVYQMDARGDRLMDYSSAGYMQGAALPDASALFSPQDFVNVNPVAGDDLANINAAISQVASRPIQPNGYRGVVQLAPGEYQISGTLQILTSGVILRGAGDGTDVASNTILRATGTTKRTLIQVGNSSGHSLSMNTPTSIIDKVVPTGATSLRVANPGGYSVGESVVVRRNATQAWIDSIGMNNINGGPEDLPWDVNDPRYDHIQERKIVRIEGDRLFFDAPIAHSIDQRLVTGQVLKYSKGRTTHVGIENLRGVTDFNAAESTTIDGVFTYTDEDHADDFISFGVMRDGWARNITSQHFGFSAVQVGGATRSVTIDDAQFLEPASQVTGSRRYSFNMNGGQFILMKNLLSQKGRHDFVNNSTFSGFNRGPNVFLNGIAIDSFSDIGPHSKYSTGVLYDNITTDNEINIRDRYAWGASHGWSGAFQVAWNSQAERFTVQNPPGARNYLIGSTGTIITDNVVANASDALGTYDSHGTRVQFNDPANAQDSLYVAQSLEKLNYSGQEMREYWIGDFDQLEYDGPGSDDDVFVDPAWLSDISTIDAGKPIASFDTDATNRRVPFTLLFDLAPDEIVASAVLTLGMKEFGAISDADELYLDDPNSPISISAGQWGRIDELEQYPDGNNAQVLVLELVGDVSYLNDGQLNGLLTDDRAIDWVHLIIYTTTGLPLAGDLDGDGFVGINDLNIVLASWNQSVPPGNPLADPSGDGFVGIDDLNTVLGNWNAGTPPEGSANIPEPGSLACLVMGVLGLLLRP